MNKEYKIFLYNKLAEVSEQKESFCEINNKLLEENIQLKSQIAELLKEKELNSKVEENGEVEQE